MSAKRDLPDGFPDPESLLRDPNWEDNWPTFILRGIHDIMEREKKAGRGSLMECYVKGFNVILYTMARVAHPPRIQVANGVIKLTSFGMKRNEMLMGRRRLDSAAKRKYGAKKTKQDFQKETKDKLNQLRIWIEILQNDLPDPAGSPARTL